MLDQQTLSKLCKLGHAGQSTVAAPDLHLQLSRLPCSVPVGLLLRKLHRLCRLNTVLISEHPFTSGPYLHLQVSQAPALLLG